MADDGVRRQYDREYKREAVRLSYERGRTVAGVARDLGINENNLWRWRKQFSKAGEEAFSGSGHCNISTSWDTFLDIITYF